MRNSTVSCPLKLWLLGALCLGSSCLAQLSAGPDTQSSVLGTVIYDPADPHSGRTEMFDRLLREARGPEFPDLLRRVFGSSVDTALQAIEQDDEALLVELDAFLRTRLEEQGEETGTAFLGQRPAQPSWLGARIPAGLVVLRPETARHVNLVRLQTPPDIQVQENDREIRAQGSDTKRFETKEARGTRTQKAETRYIKDGRSFGVEIKNTQIIEAVSIPDGKSFRKELSMLWGAALAACPDANGVTAGTGNARVISKTTYTENGATVTITSAFDLQAPLTGHVNEQAVMTHYDLVVNAHTENSGYAEALRRSLIKEIKLQDGRYGVRYDIPGNTLEVSDGTYGGKRTPAKMGKATGSRLTPMTDAQAARVDSAIGSMVPAIWHSANEMYAAAQRHWRNYGCLEVRVAAPKTVLEPGESVAVSAETVHLHDGSRVNAAMNAEAYPGQVTPESQRATPGATFTFMQEGEDNGTFSVRSVSRRGIGKGDLEFRVKEAEEPAPNAVWTGSVRVERKQREEREKRSGANLQENGGYTETTTSLRLELTGRLDPGAETANAYLSGVSGEQRQVDYEYDRYKVDEGYCGPNAVPFRGPKEITRTSTTTVRYDKETRVLVEVGQGQGSLSFSLPEQTGRTVHRYVHSSPCSDNDRANTNEATDEDVAGPGGSFSFSFPVDPAGKILRGSITVPEEDGSTTTYSWELRVRP
ncbi:hypothetical protein HNR42_000972 [Deinobacterium chartae]|uniref:Uncharacterized protein n=1 Tax=Deinobacterium chartae TaxID=521158 RepID=A0A841I0Q6_9DEIO|nr:hypothetical protein [Deinobacterium chartae]MBB6097555.1 hypothetical protein [Deinobacterium chartae]